MDSRGGISEELRAKLTGRVVVVGVGDAAHGDDGIGPMIARKLAEAGVVGAIDAGPSPEMETHRIREFAPESVLFVDAVDFGGAPGHVALLEPRQLRAEGFDTHRAPLRLTMEYLAAELRCGCFLLAVQPRDARLGSLMCDEVRESGEQLASLLAGQLRAE